MKKSICLLILTVFSVCLYSQNEIKDATEIKLDNVAFDENDLLKILDANDNVIAYYDRLENKSSNVKMAKLYTPDTNLIYSVVPVKTVTGFEIYLQDHAKRRGKIEISTKIKGFKVEYISEIDYFGLAFDYHFDYRFKLMEITVNESVTLNDEIVLYSGTTTSLSGVEETPITISESFLQNDPNNAANWALCFLLLKELTEEYTEPCIQNSTTPTNNPTHDLYQY